MSEGNTSASRPTLSLAPDVVLQVIDGDALLLKLQREDVFSLNKTGTRVAELIVRGLAVEAIVETLALEYGVAASEIAGDVLDLVDALVARGLVIRGVTEHAE